MRLHYLKGDIHILFLFNESAAYRCNINQFVIHIGFKIVRHANK